MNAKLVNTTKMYFIKLLEAQKSSISSLEIKITYCILHIAYWQITYCKRITITIELINWYTYATSMDQIIQISTDINDKSLSAKYKKPQMIFSKEFIILNNLYCILDSIFLNK